MPRSSHLEFVSLCLLALGLGCSEVAKGAGGFATSDGTPSDEPAPTDERPVVRSAVLPPPITGGTLLVAADGSTVIASDPDRDLVFVADLAGSADPIAIAVQPGDEPGRVAEDDLGHVHVALRGAGAVLTIDPTDGSVLATNETCANPRGLAYDAGEATVLVACAGGELVWHEPGGGIVQRIKIASDLRDVFVDDEAITVTTFRRALVLTLDKSGSLLDSEQPPMMFSPSSAMLPNTAWHTTPTAGGWLMMHQASTDLPIILPDVLDPDAGTGGGGFGGTGGESYGGGGFGPPDGCGPLVSSALTLRDATGEPRGMRLVESTLAVDAALSPDGAVVAIAVAGQHDAEQPTMQRVRGIALVGAGNATSEDAPCVDPEDVPVPGQPVAVAFLPGGDLVAQSREPAELYRVDVQTREVQTIALFGDSRRDTGHDLFHQDAGVGIACASCHPEGSDDGRVWQFIPLGPRRTQPLRVGLAGSEPFHWDGDMEDFGMLAREVHQNRMGGPQQSDERVAAFRDWLFALEPTPAAGFADADLVDQGRELFVDSACTTCHVGDSLTNSETVVVRGMSLQVPSLRGIALRPPYMHDGRATSLEDAVIDMLDATAPDVDATDEDVQAIVAYLRTL